MEDKIKRLLIDQEFNDHFWSNQDEFRKEININEIKIGNVLMINNNLCRLSHISCSKTPKNGTRSFHFIGINVFTDEKHEMLKRLNIRDGTIHIYV